MMRSKLFFEREGNTILFQMRRTPAKREEDVVYVTTTAQVAKGARTYSVVHVSLPDDFAYSINISNVADTPQPNIHKAAIDDKLATMLMQIWNLFLSDEHTVQPPEYGKPNIGYTFHARLREEASTGNFSDGTCEGELSALGVGLIEYADSPEAGRESVLARIRARAENLLNKL